MLAYLKGKIQWKGRESAVVEVNNLGFEIFAPKILIEKLKIGEEKTFFTHEYLREDARELYAFESRDDLKLFLDLMKVSGVGPKMALNVVSLGAEKVKKAISKGESVLLQVPGVGRKTAQKIILELKGIISESELTIKDVEAVDALRSLGYSHHEAVEALQKIKEPIESTEEKVREALKILGKR